MLILKPMLLVDTGLNPEPNIRSKTGLTPVKILQKTSFLIGVLREKRSNVFLTDLSVKSEKVIVFEHFLLGYYRF